MSTVPETGETEFHTTDGAAIRTLLVDDDPDLLEITYEMLELAGCNVTSALHPKEALSRIHNGEVFDLLFTDYRFPGFMTGIELADEATDYLPAMKVIIATGFDAETIETQRKPEYLYIAKPFSISGLKEKIAGLFPV